MNGIYYAQGAAAGMNTVGFIGVGHMGGAMARRLLEAGIPLAVHDRDQAAVAALQSRGACSVDSPRAMADLAEIVFLCLPSVQAQKDVCAGPSGLLAGSAVRIVVETSTVGPASLQELAAALRPRGIAVVDAPVSGGPRGAAAGTLSVMVSGAPEAIEAIEPLLRILAGKRFDVGHAPGLAQVCKLVNNAISAAGMVAACEATVVGVKAGLDADTLLAAINAGSGRNAGTLDKFPAAILPGSFDYGGPLGLMLKDLRLFIDQAQALGVSGRLAPATLAAWQEAVDRVGPEADYSRLIQPMEADAGVEVRSMPKMPTMSPGQG
jgi:3-hydroxyisobutyrate dehydrogenase-like beta-hydroxyacid dehydrogenase